MPKNKKKIADPVLAERAAVVAEAKHWAKAYRSEHPKVSELFAAFANHIDSAQHIES